MSTESRELAGGPTPSTLHVITDRDRRGAQVHATDLADGLARNGNHVEVVALAPGENDDLLPVEALGPWRRSPPTLRELRRRARSFDLVVAHGSATLAACSLALAAGDVPFVYRQISDPHFWAASMWRRMRVAMMLRRTQRVVALSDEVAQSFAGYYHLPVERLVTIPNAVPSTAWSPPSEDERRSARRSLSIPEDAVVGVYVGALVPEKGVDVAIEGVATTDGASLLVVGEGPERARLEHLAGQRGDVARFLGSLEDPRPALHAADLLVLASRGGDSMPAVLIEAGLCGLPSVATSVGAIGDVVLDGVTGTVVPVDDDAAAMAAIGELLADRARCRDLGRAAEQHCRSHFTIDAVVPMWESLFRSVVECDAE